MKYFMGGTPLAGLERMMIDPSRRCNSGEPKTRPKEKAVLHMRMDGKEKK